MEEKPFKIRLIYSCISLKWWSCRCAPWIHGCKMMRIMLTGNLGCPALTLQRKQIETSYGHYRNEQMWSCPMCSECCHWQIKWNRLRPIRNNTRPMKFRWDNQLQVVSKLSFCFCIRMYNRLLSLANKMEYTVTTERNSRALNFCAKPQEK